MRYGLIIGASALVLGTGGDAIAGPDVIVGFIDGGRQFAVLPTGELAITAGTNSCNAGDKDLNWMALPDANHPVISLNMYKEKDGQFRQLAATWVKHGFFATNQEDCADVAGVPACVPADAGNALGPGCSDLYGDYLNSDPQFLGPRSRINPSTGIFDSSDATSPSPGSPTILDDEKIMVVDAVTLSDPGARYFLEAQYITADDAAAGNARNNMTYREFAPHDGSPQFVARYLGPQMRGQPALAAWQGALLSERLSSEGGAPVTLIAASKATPLKEGGFRYDYAVYNMNSDRGLRSFKVEGTTNVRDASFSAAIARGEPWDKAPWTGTQNAQDFVWATQTFTDNNAANALRWGNTYSFSFVSNAAPVTGKAVAEKYKPKQGNDTDDETFEVLVPSNAPN
ncbi:hypothetical protein [Rhizobium anhuiense]|uniref:hypothetical protein n=1 Tax=Rhizobium anhuiense TaxID=1184720 RepID=UPI0020CF2DE6|nr:hypothetical protein [Rhizobium anhuiense]UTS90334.1 hypothetical protein NE851_27595 [Rhizobium anhuiense bv. trifolii]